MDYNKILARVIDEQIMILRTQKKVLEMNKDFRKVPFSLKKAYYNGYDMAMERLYELSNGIAKGDYVKFEEYQNILDIIEIVKDYLVCILDGYDIKYEII